MKIYIRSVGNVSPQHSLEEDLFFRTRVKTNEHYFKSLEPDYDQFIDPKMIRRMSRIVKMGVAAAMTCLKKDSVKEPAAILTATAYGCLEDTSSFLRRMIEFEEKLLSPTAFIQSTHNTVGGQIALLLKCHRYNSTIVHNAFSLENALMETQMLLSEGPGPVLVGAVDEITDDRQAILSRFNLYKKTHVNSTSTIGNIAGEGASFFLLDSDPGTHALAVLRDVQTLYRPESVEQVEQEMRLFLKQNELQPNQVDLVLTPHTGNSQLDEPDDFLLKTVFRDLPCFPFKSLCGDYPTASGFAVWLASVLVNAGRAPEWMEGLRFPLRNILIHHRQGDRHHSFILISAVE